MIDAEKQNLIELLDSLVISAVFEIDEGHKVRWHALHVETR